MIKRTKTDIKKVSFDEVANFVPFEHQETPSELSVNLQSSFRLDQAPNREDIIKINHNSYCESIFSPKIQNFLQKNFDSRLELVASDLETLLNIKDKQRKFFDLVFYQEENSSPSHNINLSKIDINLRIKGGEFSEEKLKETLVISFLVFSGLISSLDGKSEEIFEKQYEGITTSLGKIGISEDRLDDLMDMALEVNKEIVGLAKGKREVAIMSKALRSTAKEYVKNSQDRVLGASLGQSQRS